MFTHENTIGALSFSQFKPANYYAAGAECGYKNLVDYGRDFRPVFFAKDDSE